MKKGSIFLLSIIFTLIILNISMILVSDISAEEVIWQGCTGDVFGLVIHGDRREDFEIDATHMAELSSRIDIIRSLAPSPSVTILMAP